MKRCERCDCILNDTFFFIVGSQCLCKKCAVDKLSQMGLLLTGLPPSKKKRQEKSFAA